MLLLSLSPFYIWELLGRSNIFVNAVLVLASLIYFFKKELDLKRLIITGIMVGLLMSSRNVFVIPYSIAFLFALRSRWIRFKQFAALGLIAIVVFCFTFSPFLVGHFHSFMEMNPFLVQSTFLIPFEYTLGFVSMAMMFGFLCKTKTDVYFYSGICLFISILIYFLYHIIQVGFYKTYFESIGDVSYFILSIPFLLYYMIVMKMEQSDFPNLS